MRKKEIIFVTSLFIFSNAFAQTESERKINLPSIGIGGGIISYRGNIGDNKVLTPFSSGFMGFNVLIQERIGFFGFSLNVLKGKVSASERSLARNLNFESPILDASFNLSFHFDNGFILPKTALIAPYLSIGVGYLSFKPKADLKDKDGNYYYYWSNGSIRDISETDLQNKSKAKVITRDYVYETDLPAAGDSLNNDNIPYSYTSLTLPITGGIMFKLSPSFHVNMGASYYIAQTDWIDNVSTQSKGIRKGTNPHDSYLYTFVGIQYNLGQGKKAGDQTESNNKTLDALVKDDSDKDKVQDIFDDCPDTPEGVKVNSKGCPLDSDGDGIPDHLDKEPNTKKGKIVNANGVTLQDDSLAVEHEASIRVVPGNENSQKIQNNSQGSNTSENNGMPEKYKAIDLNNDGKISTDEINSAIDNFFEGNTKLTIEGIYGLIDYFFEQ
jgi:hypothetical protein